MRTRTSPSSRCCQAIFTAIHATPGPPTSRAWCRTPPTTLDTAQVISLSFPRRDTGIMTQNVLSDRTFLSLSPAFHFTVVWVLAVGLPAKRFILSTKTIPIALFLRIRRKPPAVRSGNRSKCRKRIAQRAGFGDNSEKLPELLASAYPMMVLNIKSVFRVAATACW